MSSLPQNRVVGVDGHPLVFQTGVLGSLPRQRTVNFDFEVALRSLLQFSW